MRAVSSSSLATAAFFLLAALPNTADGEIFTNPFELRAAFIAENRVVGVLLGLGVDDETELGKAISECV